MKNRTRLLFIAITFFSFGVGMILSGCASTRIKKMSGTEFLIQAKLIESPNSFVWMNYIGASDERAYLEYGYPAFIGGGKRTIVFWTPLIDLPEDIAKQLLAGGSPWKKW